MIYRADAPGRWLLVAIDVGALGAQAAFDFLGGVTLMPDPRPSAMTFLRTWSRGFLVHTLVLAGVGLASALSLRFTGGFGAGIALATLALGHTTSTVSKIPLTAYKGTGLNGTRLSR